MKQRLRMFVTVWAAAGFVFGGTVMAAQPQANDPTC